MKRALAALLLIAGTGCIEPPKTNRALVYVGGLQDLTRWDPVNGGRGHDAYDAMLSLEPTDSVPVLIATLLDPTPTGIYDRLHEPVTVGDVAFHMLLFIFSMKAEDFGREGVWVFTGDPVKNPIYQVRIEKNEVREKLRQRFAKLAIDRGWYPKE
jgi:hypothetical protein